MILIIICSLTLRPGLLLCLQVMYSSVAWFTGEERGKREGEALRGKLSTFHDFWVSETVPKFLGVLEVLPCMMKALGFCIVCFILQYFMILMYSESCWFVTSFSSLPREESSLETQEKNNARKVRHCNRATAIRRWIPLSPQFLQSTAASDHLPKRWSENESIFLPLPSLRFPSCTGCTGCRMASSSQGSGLCH